MVVVNCAEVPATVVAGQEVFNSATGDSSSSEWTDNEELGQEYVRVGRHVLEWWQGNRNEADGVGVCKDYVSPLEWTVAGVGGRIPQIGSRCRRSDPVLENVGKPSAVRSEAVEIGVEARDLMHVHWPNVSEKSLGLGDLPRIDKAHIG